MSDRTGIDLQLVETVTSLVTAQMAKSHSETDTDIDFFDRQIHSIIGDAGDDFSSATILGSTIGFLTALVHHVSDETDRTQLDIVNPIVEALDRHPDRPAALIVARQLLFAFDSARAAGRPGPEFDPADCWTDFTDATAMTLRIIDGLMIELAAAMDIAPMDMLQVFFGTNAVEG
ncbi:hypothetical protein [Aeromicrobium sp. 179-A 4D2 NHS]|uniref:hypothetical protein n=1 Tax=Aeromicrobium sp. 179-A 4D2 NHS TaxID=3142375 RepID=UPI0039A21183